jgi:hypothetical protein
VLGSAIRNRILNFKRQPSVSSYRVALWQFLLSGLTLSMPALATRMAKKQDPGIAQRVQTARARKHL